MSSLDRNIIKIVNAVYKKKEPFLSVIALSNIENLPPDLTMDWKYFHWYFSSQRRNARYTDFSSLKNASAKIKCPPSDKEAATTFFPIKQRIKAIIMTLLSFKIVGCLKTMKIKTSFPRRIFCTSLPFGCAI